MALTIIFGAGASYDSCSAPDFRIRPPSADTWKGTRPPLTKDLFDETVFHDQVQGHQNCVALITRLRSVVQAQNRSIEEALEEIAREAAEYPHVARQMFALRHYIQAVIQHCSQRWSAATAGATNYVALLDRIEKWRHDRGKRVNLISFNYDTLLEQACTSVLGMRLYDVDDCLAHPHYKVLKVHGSINWLRKLTNVGTVAPIDSLHDLHWTDEYRTIFGQISSNHGEAYVPAIAVPTVTKVGFECPPSHLEEVDRAIAQTEKLIVIGWRGAESHFLNRWASMNRGKLENILIITAPHSELATVLANLQRGGVDFRSSMEFAEGYSMFLDTRQLEEFLG